MRVYKFIDKKWGLHSLKSNTIKVSLFGELNDPFELIPMSLESKADRGILNRRTNEFSKAHGLICFSKKRSNPVMWSHYADKHKGMVLAFDVPKSDLNEVDYSTRRLANLGKGQDFSELLTTKFQHWHYETEYRKFIELKNCNKNSEGTHTIPFSRKLYLKAVYLGPKYRPSKDIKIQRELAKRGVEIITTRLAFQSFQVIRQKSEILWKTL